MVNLQTDLSASMTCLPLCTGSCSTWDTCDQRRVIYDWSQNLFHYWGSSSLHHLHLPPPQLSLGYSVAEVLSPLSASILLSDVVILPLGATDFSLMCTSICVKMNSLKAFKEPFGKSALLFQTLNRIDRLCRLWCYLFASGCRWRSSLVACFCLHLVLFEQPSNLQIDRPTVILKCKSPFVC